MLTVAIGKCRRGVGQFVLFLLFLQLICVGKVAFAAAEAMDEKALAVLEQTVAYYQTLENFRAVYRLSIRYPEEDKLYRSTMVITVRGEQSRCCYNHKETITDGETIWVYDKDLKEVTISSYEKTDYALNFLELCRRYQQDYILAYKGEQIVSLAKKARIQDLVQLIPIANNDWQHITLAIDRATAQIHGWEIVQNDETSYICTLDNFSINLPLADDYFTFDPMAHGDIEIIDLREDEASSDEMES
ncbi:LolA family protein [Candidatus Cardinium hertigii]|uniref:Outer-membrane lipoprotein carrier protein n=1 Tax=Candidatus Cardinium hertigii TaxID=247481 RepID=A0A2Z3L6Y3_9BACT|nr:outer membrane lipoprotein carrier protein LolA [Candidatus Cardinium hertigii]AWN81413.1 Outer-membrane lipoprotein carrier protein [Candidatus Cardinium hertigii]